MIRANQVAGLPVIDVDAADKMGEVEDLVLDLDAGLVAGIRLTHGPPLIGGRQHQFLAASAVRGLGPDALTVHRPTGTLADAAHLESLPRASILVGRKVVSHGGQLLGIVEDVLIEPQDGRVIGYALGAAGPTVGLDRLLGGGRSRQPDYVRADSEVRVGRSLIVVPDQALVRMRDGNGGPEATSIDTLMTASTVQWRDPQPLAGRAGGEEPLAGRAGREELR